MGISSSKEVKLRVESGMHKKKIFSDLRERVKIMVVGILPKKGNICYRSGM